jgi:hypothetical protein
MKAMPKKITGGWITAKCDDSVRYKLRPLTNRHQMWMVENAMDEDRNIKEITASYALVRVSLIEVDGLTNEDGSQIEFTTERVNVNGLREDLVSFETMDRLPLVLISEIALSASSAIEGLNKTEVEELGFTSGSSEESVSSAPDATETNETAQ